MKDRSTPCHHCVSEDAVYKEVVVIGNGPSGIITSLLLSGYVPYVMPVPEELPIDQMLRARLVACEGQSLLKTDLAQLAEGLEGRSQNPVPLLMDNLLNPCADLGMQAEPLLEWRHDVEKQIEHVVLGKGPPGGSWHAFDPSVLTLSPSGWLVLPPHRALPGRGRDERAPAGDVASYYAKYVRSQGLQRHFRNSVSVTDVSPLGGLGREPCNAACPLAARWCVTGYDTASRRAVRYACRRVVLASGASDRPNTLPACGVTARALHDLSLRDRALSAAEQSEHPVLVVGSGLSAADAVTAARRAGRRAAHVYRARATALASLSPSLYPDYCEVYKMMRDGPSGKHSNYIPLPEHALVEVTSLDGKIDHREDSEDVASVKRVKLLDLVTNQVKELTVTVIFILIGSKPDLHFLPGNFDLSYISINEPLKREVCTKCNNMHAAKRKMADQNDRNHFFRDHWHYIKSMVGQSIQSCKSRYWDYSTEINGNSDTECAQPDCKRRDMENNVKNRRKNYTSLERVCKCQLTNPYSSGLGFGVDPTKPVDCRTNPIYIDKGTHEVMNAPKGMYALGPLTSDNFVRFISGGAVAAVSHMWQERKLEMTD